MFRAKANRFLYVRRSSTLCYFETKKLPACLKDECLRVGQSDPKHRMRRCDQTFPSPRTYCHALLTNSMPGFLPFSSLLVDLYDAFAHEVLTRLHSLEHDRDKAHKEKEESQSLVFLRDLYSWVRDTVLNKAVTDTPMTGELVIVDWYAEGVLDRYLPSAMNYVVLGKSKVYHKYRDEVESNFVKFEAYALDALKVDLRAIQGHIHVPKDPADHIPPASAADQYPRRTRTAVPLPGDRAGREVARQGGGRGQGPGRRNDAPARKVPCLWRGNRHAEERVHSSRAEK
jgi:hypothetical protein